ncbi:hypothetical protein GCM10010276_87360 [Streptomyces longisporus]|uniref:Uncharacterized protein n=1 Tax=Streptomyces longisporus TaxID=1948 RepID=A0ABP6AT69_STRLO
MSVGPVAPNRADPIGRCHAYSHAEEAGTAGIGSGPLICGARRVSAGVLLRFEQREVRLALLLGQLAVEGERLPQRAVCPWSACSTSVGLALDVFVGCQDQTRG